MAEICSSKPEVLISQPYVHLATIFGLCIGDFGLLMRVVTPNTKPYVVLRCHSCHLDSQ